MMAFQDSRTLDDTTPRLDPRHPTATAQTTTQSTNKNIRTLKKRLRSGRVGDLVWKRKHRRKGAGRSFEGEIMSLCDLTF